MKRIFTTFCLLTLSSVASEPQFEFLVDGWGGATGVVRRGETWFRSFHLNDWKEVALPQFKWSVQVSETELCVVDNTFEVKCPKRSLGFIPKDTIQFERYALRTAENRIYHLKTRLKESSLETRYEETNIAAIEGTVTKLTGSESHVCALVESGNIFCWGGNQAGRLGLGGFPFVQFPENDTEWSVVSATPAIPFPTHPVVVKPEVKFIDVVTRGRTTCALSDEAHDNVYCWGRLSELTGTETDLDKVEKTTSSTPRRLDFQGKRLVAISVDLLLGLAVDSDGVLYAWGGVDPQVLPTKIGDIGKAQCKSMRSLPTGICVIVQKENEPEQLLCKPRDLVTPLRPVL